MFDLYALLLFTISRKIQHRFAEYSIGEGGRSNVHEVLTYEGNGSIFLSLLWSMILLSYDGLICIECERWWLFVHCIIIVLYCNASILFYQYEFATRDLQIDWNPVMQLHQQWQDLKRRETGGGTDDGILTINGVGTAEDSHAAPEITFRVTGDRISMKLKKQGYTSMDAAGTFSTRGLLCWKARVIRLWLRDKCCKSWTAWIDSQKPGQEIVIYTPWYLNYSPVRFGHNGGKASRCRDVFTFWELTATTYHAVVVLGSLRFKPLWKIW